MKAIFVLFLIATALAQEPDYALSLAGQGDRSFWAKPVGTQRPEGEVGLGDFVRTLAMRRSNSPRLRQHRDRYFYRSRSFRDFITPDCLVARLGVERLEWTQRPSTKLVAMQDSTLVLPLVLESDLPVSAAPEIFVNGKKVFETTKFVRYGAAGYILRTPVAERVRIDLRWAGYESHLEIPIEVRPIAKLKVRLSEPARIYLTGADGLSYAPSGSIARIAAMPSEYYFHAAGTFEVEVPAGLTQIEALRGLEYEVAKQEVALQAGQNPEVKIELRRWSDLGRKGWYSGDSHIHANYASHDYQNIQPEDVRLIAEGEDLNVMNLVAANSYDEYIHDERFFSGAPHPASTAQNILYWNEEFRGSDLYGHIGFFRLKRLVLPIFTGLSGVVGDYPTNYHQAKQAREQGGAVSYMHPGYLPTFDGLAAAGGQAKELPVDVALGVIDAMDVLSNSYETAAVPIYYRLLNCGFRLAISAGTDTFLNVRDHYIPGGGRVYVKAGAPLNYDNWIEAYKRGQTFVTNGPMIEFTVNGKGAGEEMEASGPVRIRAQVDSRVPIDKVELIVNGRVVRTRSQSGSIDETISLKEASWIAVRVSGPWSRQIVNDSGAFAHTSPVYVTMKGKRTRNEEDLRFFRDWIAKLIAQVKASGKFATAAQREEVVQLFEKARAAYRSGGDI